MHVSCFVSCTQDEAAGMRDQQRTGHLPGQDQMRPLKFSHQHTKARTSRYRERGEKYFHKKSYLHQMVWWYLGPAQSGSFASSIWQTRVEKLPGPTPCRLVQELGGIAPTHFTLCISVTSNKVGQYKDKHSTAVRKNFVTTKGRAGAPLSSYHNHSFSFPHTVQPILAKNTNRTPMT